MGTTRPRSVLVIGLVTTLLAALLALMNPTQARAEGPDAVVDCGEISGVLPRNDDGFTGAQDIGFPVRFLGDTYTQLFVNNNGNVTFDEGMSTYSPFDLYQTNRPIIAPFFTDVDTRNPATSPVTYGPFNYDGGLAFCVNWVNVGEFSNGAVPNSFQLLLVDRSVPGRAETAGDFDMVFNYDKVLWDHGQARAGYSNGSGDPGSALELNGSGTGGAFFDSNLGTGLIRNYAGQSPNDPQLGRYIFRIRNGEAPPPGILTGEVRRQDDASVKVAGAMVQACRVPPGIGCRTTTTNSVGQYAFVGMPADVWALSVNPPAGTGLFPRSGIGPVVVPNTSVPVQFPIDLTGPAPLPANVDIEGAIGGDQTGQIPTVVVGNVLEVTRTGCFGGSGVLRVFQGGVQRDLRLPISQPSDSSIIATEAPMWQDPPGTYHARFILPFTGSAEVRVEIDGCPPTIFNIYIDPSGFIRTVGGDPIPGATVVLYRSEAVDGPFEVVPDGHPIMSPSNTTNPDTTDATGHFGWDVIAGYYFVRASAPGCVDPTNPANDFRDTVVYEIPPPVTDIDLRLDCDPGGTTPTPPAPGGPGLPIDLPTQGASDELGDDMADFLGRVGEGNGTNVGEGGLDPANPVGTRVTPGTAGRVAITEHGTGFDAPAGWASLPVTVDIAAPASEGDPIRLEFRLDGSLLPAGEDEDTIGVFRNGALVGTCTAADELGPDPCVTDRHLDGDDVVIVVLTSRASTWAFAVPDTGSIDAVCAGKGSSYSDVAGDNVHGRAIGCIAERNITQGVGGGRYQPAGDVTRGQIASFLARTMANLGITLPTGADVFTDDDDSVHQDAINALFAAGVVEGVTGTTYAPGAVISRDQMASLLVRAYQYASGRTVTGVADAFTDDNGSVHEANIDIAAALGLTTGQTADWYVPRAPVRRDQMATFLSRLLNRTVLEAMGVG